jgi:transposase
MRGHRAELDPQKKASELTAVAVPSPEQEALRDLVRAREAAKKDQIKARHRLSQFLLCHRQKPEGIQSWTKQVLAWIKSHVHFPHKAQEVAWLNYLHEVEHVAQRIQPLEQAIDEAVREAPAELPKRCRRGAAGRSYGGRFPSPAMCIGEGCRWSQLVGITTGRM